MGTQFEIGTLINDFLGAFICCLGMFLVGSIIFNKKFDKSKITNYLFLIIATIVIIVNAIFLDSIIKIFGTLEILYILFRVIYKDSVMESVILAITSYVLTLIGEIIFILLISLLAKVYDSSITEGIVRSLFANIFISMISVILAIIIKKRFYNHYKDVYIKNFFSISILFIITIFVIVSSAYKLFINNWILDYEFLLNFVIIIGCSIVTYLLLKQYKKNKEIVDKYNLLDEYLKSSAELIENYNSTIHKYKNHLIAIKGYMKSDLKEADKYIDSLLDKVKNEKYSWINKINKVNQSSIRYLIYYKLSRAEENHLKLSIDVSDSIKKIIYSNIDVNMLNMLLELIGEYFDNALYACNESDEKLLSLIMCGSNSTFTFTLINSMKGSCDINLVTRNGYTTKGKGHGFGLYEMDKIIKSNDNINVKYEIIDNNFVVNLEVKI